MTTDIDDLMAALDAEVPAKGSKTTKPPAIQRVAQRIRPAVDVTEPDSGWHATARVVLVQHQRCTCCGNVVSAIANHFVQYERQHRDASHSRVLKALTLVSERTLPRLVEHAQIEVPECWACLLAEEYVAALGLDDIVVPQGSLFQ
jgi:hypothetical protein